MNDSVMRDLLTVAERVGYEGEPITPEDLDLDLIDDPQDALGMYRRAVMQRQAAQAVEHAAGQRLAELLGEGGAARYGDNIVSYHRGWRERCIDPAGFWDGVALLASGNEVRVRDLFNPNDVKKSPMPKALRDTFFDRTRNTDATLVVTPVGKAPKFLQALDDGDVWKAET
jgi:hypothetical protein